MWISRGPGPDMKKGLRPIDRNSIMKPGYTLGSRPVCSAILPSYLCDQVTLSASPDCFCVYYCLSMTLSI